MSSLIMISIIFAVVWIPAMGARFYPPRQGLRVSIIATALFTCVYFILLLFVIPKIF